MYPWVQINSSKVVKDIISLEKVLNNLSEDGAKEIDDDFVFFDIRPKNEAREKN